MPKNRHNIRKYMPKIGTISKNICRKIGTISRNIVSLPKNICQIGTISRNIVNLPQYINPNNCDIIPESDTQHSVRLYSVVPLESIILHIKLAMFLEGFVSSVMALPQHRMSRRAWVLVQKFVRFCNNYILGIFKPEST